MKLLVVTMLYEPDCVGIAAIATDLCHSLAERGHDVTVYTTHPYYPEWKRKSQGNPWRITDEVLSEVHVRRHGLYIPRHPSRLLPRLLHEASFPLSLTRSLFSRDRFDVVMVFCPLLGSVAFATLRKLLRREPLWLNVQDMPAEAGLATGINKSKAFSRLASSVQRRLFDMSDMWSSISPEMVDQLVANMGDAGRAYLCPNWLVKQLADHVSQQTTKLGRPCGHPIKLLYCGTIGKKQDLQRFCQRIVQLPLEFEFQVRGAGSEAGRLEKWIASRGDSRFRFGPLTSDAEFVRAIHDADWFVITEMQGVGSSFLPSKLIPCIAVGTPVLSLCDLNGPLGREVSGHRLGLSLEWSQIADLPRRLAEYCRDPELFTELQSNCLVRSRDFDRKHATDRIEMQLLKLSGGDSPRWISGHGARTPHLRTSSTSPSSRTG